MIKIEIPKYLYIIYPSYCTILLFFDFFGYNRLIIYNYYGWWFSIFYFIIDLIIEISNFNYIYILHHSVCLTLLLLKLIWKDEVMYSNFMNLGLTMEVSNIFLNLRPLLKGNKEKENINNILFVISWFITRIFYSIPMTIYLVYFKKVDGGQPFLISIAIFAVVILHLYWGFLILKKVYQQIYPKKDL